MFPEPTLNLDFFLARLGKKPLSNKHLISTLNLCALEKIDQIMRRYMHTHPSGRSRGVNDTGKNKEKYSVPSANI